MKVNDYFSGRILNIGHRGAPEAAPENTIPSFLKALELGADGIELDVTLSRDGEIVVFHNYLLPKTTDGKGLLARQTLSELQSLDAGSHFSVDYAGTCIPTLEELVEAVGEETFFMIEIKTNPFSVKGIEKAVAQFIGKHNMYHRVVVSSFSPLDLRRVRYYDNKIPLGLLNVPILPFFMNRFSFKTFAQAEVVHPMHQLVNRKFLKHARAGGVKTMAWTVNRKKDMERMVDLGVEGVITNYPELFDEVLKEKNKK